MKELNSKKKVSQNMPVQSEQRGVQNPKVKSLDSNQQVTSMNIARTRHEREINAIKNQREIGARSVWVYQLLIHCQIYQLSRLLVLDVEEKETEAVQPRYNPRHQAEVAKDEEDFGLEEMQTKQGERAPSWKEGAVVRALTWRRLEKLSGIWKSRCQKSGEDST